MDGIIRHVLQAIVEQCMNKGVQVSNALAAIVLRATILKNASGMQMEDALKKSDLQSLVQMCVARLVETNSPSLETIKQQVTFESKLISEHERLEELAHQHTYMTKNLLAEIATLNARGYSAMELLYRKAVAYMLTSSKLGESTDVTAVKETTAVLETVFPREELQAFLACSRQEREFQMEELSVIVAGIRLLNRELGKGGECIDDAPSLAIDKSSQLENLLHEEINVQRTAIHRYTTAIAHLHYQVDTNRSLNTDRVKRLQDEANNHQQFLSHTTILLEDVADLRDRLVELKGLYQESISGLKNATADPAKTPPPEKIFPMFMTLAKIWQQIEKERAQLGARDNLFKSMLGMKGSFTPSLTEEDVKEATLDSPLVLTKVSTTKFNELDTSKPSSGAVVLSPKSIPGPSILEFKGFCPWTIVKREGLLVKSDTTNAIVRFRNKYYACASDQAISEFTANPTEFIEGVINLAKAKPELIFLLDLQNVFPSMQPLSTGIMRKGKLIQSQGSTPAVTTENAPAKKDADTQTEAHPVPSYIDRNYCWNEWQLRRNAIKLVELRYKATHSTQTKNSHFRRDNYSQHYAPKESNTQTGISTGTSPTINKNYVTGLRGKPQQAVKVVKLQLDL